jgi:Zn-dependent metalloprotease
MTQPPHTKIDYRSNGTPSLVKGENLAAALGAVPEFEAALKNKDHARMACLFLESYKRFFKLADPRQNFTVESTQTDKLGSTHVRFQQLVHQLPVWEKTIRIHFNNQNALYLIQGDYLPAAALENVETTARLTSSDARNIALASASPGKWRVHGDAAMVYVTESQEPRLAYAMTLAKGLAGRYHYIIDALDGRILAKASLIRHF